MLTSEDKMSRIEAHKFHVIRFLDKKYTGTLDHVCVPRSWIQPNDDTIDILVNVWYPDEDHKYTERRVRKRKKKSSQWKSFLSIVKFSTNEYEEAKSFVEQINQEKKQGDSNGDFKKCLQEGMNKSERTNGDHTTLSETAEENKAKIDNKGRLMNILKTMNWYVSTKSTNCLTIKRKTQQTSEKEVPNKRSRETELDESDDDVVESSSQAYKNKANHLSRNHELSDEDLGTYETHNIEKSNDSHSSEYKQTVNRDPSKVNQSLDTATLAKLMQLANLTSELKKKMGNEVLKPLLNEHLNTDDDHCSQNKYTTASAPRDITAGVPKHSKKKINKERPKEKDVDFEPTKNKKIKFSEPLQRKSCPELFKELFGPSDSDEEIIDDADKYEEPYKGKCSPKRTKKVVVLPPDYDENDSRWTLRYRELKQGLVELEEGTGVYVSAAILSCYKTCSGSGTVFALRLLREIFKKSALSTCSWTGAGARPGLNLAARTLLLRYASDHSKMKGWPNWDTKTILRSIRNKLARMRP